MVCCIQEEIESLFVSVRDVILARPDSNIADLTALLSSPRRRRMRELQLDDLSDLLQVLSDNAHSQLGVACVVTAALMCVLAATCIYSCNSMFYMLGCCVLCCTQLHSSSCQLQSC